jgi:hypothetical protein
MLQQIVVQSLPRRCPYCDQVISYDGIELRPGENPIECPSCHRIFIKVVEGEL